MNSGLFSSYWYATVLRLLGYPKKLNLWQRYVLPDTWPHKFRHKEYVEIGVGWEVENLLCRSAVLLGCYGSRTYSEAMNGTDEKETEMETVAYRLLSQYFKETEQRSSTYFSGAKIDWTDTSENSRRSHLIRALDQYMEAYYSRDKVVSAKYSRVNGDENQTTSPQYRSAKGKRVEWGYNISGYIEKGNGSLHERYLAGLWFGLTRPEEARRWVELHEPHIDIRHFLWSLYPSMISYTRIDVFSGPDDHYELASPGHLVQSSHPSPSFEPNPKAMCELYMSEKFAYLNWLMGWHSKGYSYSYGYPFCRYYMMEAICWMVRSYEAVEGDLPDPPLPFIDLINERRLEEEPINYTNRHSLSFSVHPDFHYVPWGHVHMEEKNTFYPPNKFCGSCGVPRLVDDTSCSSCSRFFRT